MKVVLFKKVMLLTMFMVIGVVVKATEYYVSVTGNDVTGNGSSSQPWLTVQHAVTQVAAGQGHTINVAAGTYVFNSQLNLPEGINLIGAGSSQTIFKFNSTLYYPIVDGVYHFDKVMIRLEGGTNTLTQILRDFQIDGDGKQVWGGMYISSRGNMEIYNLTIKDTYFMGIWLWDVTNSSLHDSYFQNCAWGSSGWQSGSIQLGNIQNANLYNLNISEGIIGTPAVYGYGMKTLAPEVTANQLSNVKLYNSVFTCNPVGIWNNGQAPNIAAEWHNVKLLACEIYGNTFNNNISLVNNVNPNILGEISVRVHNNEFLKPPGAASYYAIELTENYAEIDHNHFDGGPYPIVLWAQNGVPATGWKIHHNTFINNQWYFIRTEVVLSDVKFYNNTFYINRTDLPYCFLATGSGSSSSNFEIKNNIFTSVSGATPVLFQVENGATAANITATYNCLHNVNVGAEVDIQSNNITTDPLLTASGNQPEPFFFLQSGSPCINTGTSVGFSVPDGQPDRGAYEYSQSGGTTEIIDFSTQASGYGTLDNDLYNQVAGVDVTFNQVERYDGSMWMGGPDHSSSSDSKMGFFPTNTASVTFSDPVQVPSLWISMLVYGQYGAIISGKIDGSQAWTKTIPGEDYGHWVEVINGVGIQIDEITFTGVENYGLDDITIVNTGGGGSPGGRTANGVAMNDHKIIGQESIRFNVYPNPVKSGENLKLTLPGASKVKLMDLSGKILKLSSVDDQQTEISTEGLAGLYLLRVEYNTFVRSLKIVIH